MAVIRQRTEIFNKPVGVVRADAGAASVAQSISRAAENIAALAYRDAAISAEETGKKAALAQPSDRISTIDPDTNMPVAYSPPSSYGTIAARSYQNMIDRRFEESILKELENKGSEFAKKSASAAQYKDSMSNYVQEMYNAEGEATAYSRYIQEAGKEYIASTYATLAKKEAEAAKAALIRQQLMDGYKDKRKLAQLISIGGSNEEIADLSASLRARNLDLLNVDGVTFKQWVSENEAIDGLQALHANNDLVRIYSRLSPSDQSLLKLSLTNPSVISKLSIASDVQNIENLQGLILKAKTSTSVTSLIAAFDSFAAISEEYVESEANRLISEHSPTISASSTIQDIASIVAPIEDKNVQLEVGNELITTWIMKNLDVAGKTSDDIDMLAEALMDEANPNYTIIQALIGGNQGKQIVRELQNMSQEQRSTLATNLSDRRAALNRIENARDARLEDRFRSNIISLQDADNYLDIYADLKTRVPKSGLNATAKSTLLTLLDENFSERSRIESDRIGLSTVELEELSDAITQPSTTLTGNALEAWKLLRPAYELNPSRISSYVSNRLRASTNQNTKELNRIRINAIEDDLSSVSEDELAFYEKEVLGDIVITAENMFEYEAIKNAASQGVILPKMKTALESAIFSNREENLNTGLQTFERFSNIETVTTDGRIGSLDIMRKSLSPEIYALYSAITQTARAEGVEPLSVALDFRNYDGNIDDDIKADLKIPNAQSINRVLDEYPMSNNYKKEILAMLRMQKARGRVITEDSLSSIIDGYTSNMAKDPAVFGPYIGDSTEFPRNAFFSDTEITSNRSAMTDLMADSGQFNDLLKGGTFLDQQAATIAAMIGGDILTTSRAIVEQFTTGVGASEKLSDRERLKRGLAALNIELAYKPDVASIYAGEPRYYVGYVNDYGSFEPIIINDKPYMLEKLNTLSSNQGELRLQALNNLTVALKGNAPKEFKAIAQINYLATLDHMNYDKFTSDEAGLRKFSEIFGNDTRAIEIYETKRREYNDLSGSKPLRIKITEGVVTE